MRRFGAPPSIAVGKRSESVHRHKIRDEFSLDVSEVQVGLLEPRDEQFVPVQQLPDVPAALVPNGLARTMSAVLVQALP
jgi:hypothetical protein